MFAGKDVLNTKIINVYQLDSDATVFEFRANIENSCGGVYWRVESPNESVADRKFSMILTAYSTGGNVSFYDKERCEGNRSIVSWVRLEG